MRPTPSTSASLPPATLCGYTVLRSPSPGTYIALADAGREIFLKPLDPDCILHGQLHPSIKERLARVRELALKSTANLHGVERDPQHAGGHGVYLVWEYIAGQSLESHGKSLAAPQLLSLLREVVLSVEALNQVGIVHGALHARNIIIDPSGRPHLTHISPLLFHDPAADEAALSSMIRSLVDYRPDIDRSLSTTLSAPASLRELAARLVAAETPQSESVATDTGDHRQRRRTLILALTVTVIGALAAVAFAMVSGHL